MAVRQLNSLHEPNHRDIPDIASLRVKGGTHPGSKGIPSDSGILDRTGLGVFYGRFSDHFEERGSETVIELNHVFPPTPFLYLTPDLQYVINPSGTDIPDAFVLGFEAGFTF
jgi:hypothetical protein